ncbi:MAG: ribonuclease HI family protein [Aquabacterium sp.]|jgi:ribonuclease HI|uniref:ribonuclease HI family protein n=1 Tax=Aquabacterium sp. TaxID=1872578 RepID=UPI002A36BC0D|nr:ribonuclease HI family protein [Aquabacterium sp.]MDX9842316.1 ribonuclease HI family protein [Aquabacterium sp.]
MPASSSDSPIGASWVIHCDGSALPNPGRMGLGAVLIAPDGTRQTLTQATHTIGCNNEAELRAVMAALRSLPGTGCGVEVYSDNSVLVEQLMQANARPIARLASLFDEAREMLTHFDPCVVRWLPRHRNTEADALARQALGMPPKTPSPPPKRPRHKR